MGGSSSSEPANENTREAQQQQQAQRAQILLLTQLQELRANDPREAGWTGPGINLVGGIPQVRPMEPPALRVAQVFENPAHLRGKTIRLKVDNGGDMNSSASAVLRFTCDVTAKVFIAAHRMAMIGQGADGTYKVTSSEWSSSPVECKDGLNQDVEIEFQMGTLTPSTDVGPGVSPVLVELSVPESESCRGAVEWTCAKLAALPGSDGHTPLDIMQQQVVLSGDLTERPNLEFPALEMQEVYGSEKGADGNDDRRECVVCMSEPRDTAMLPCRHMCLCGGCADQLRSRTQYRSYRCPICRERISSMMMIDPLGNSTVPSAQAATAC